MFYRNGKLLHSTTKAYMRRQIKHPRRQEKTLTKEIKLQLRHMLLGRIN